MNSSARQKKVSSPLCLGVHVSIAGSLPQAVERARSLACRTMQVFSRSPRSWKAGSLESPEVEKFRHDRQEAKISPLAVHASYLINLAASETVLFRKSLEGMEQELRRSDQIGADYLVVHVGSNSQRGPQFGTGRVVEALKRIGGISAGTQILLENTAGERGDIGSRMEELGEICERLGKGFRLGFCLDTCHAFAAGYDLSHPEGVEAWLKEIQKTVGLARVKLLHLNDSKKGLGCRVDRHEHIGKGGIGLQGFRTIVRHPTFQKIPMILETPKEREGDDRRNLDTVLRLCGTP